MFQKLSLLITTLVTIFVSLSAFSSSKSAEEKDQDLPWLMSNCHMGIQEWSLLRAIKDKAIVVTPPLLSGFMAPLLTDAQAVGTPLPVPQYPAVIQDLADNMRITGQSLEESLLPNVGLPHFSESQEKINQTRAAFDAQTFAQLSLIAQHNPLIRNCQVQLRGRDRKDFFWGSRYWMNTGEPIALLAALEMLNLEKYFSARLSKSSPTSESEAIDQAIESPNAQEVSYKLHSFFLRIGRVYNSAMFKSDAFKKETRLAGALVKWGEMPVQYVIKTRHDSYPKVSIPLSQMVPAEFRAQIPFDDSVIDGMGVPFMSGNGWSTQTQGARSYAIGTSSREKTAQAQIEKCFQGFRATGSAKIGDQMSQYLSLHCRQNSELVMLFVPLSSISLKNIYHDQNGNESTVKEETKGGMTSVSYLDSTAYYEKRFLQLSGHRSDFDSVATGMLLMTSREAFTKTFRNSINKLEGRNLTDTELQKKIDSILKSLNDGAMKVKQTDPNFLRDFLAFTLALVSGPSDQAETRFAYRAQDSHFEIIGLTTETAFVHDLMKKLSPNMTDEQKKLVKNIFDGKDVSPAMICLKQTELITNSLGRVFSARATPTHREAALKKVKVLEDLIHVSEGAMSDLCRVTFSEEMDKVLKNAYDHANKLPR